MDHSYILDRLSKIEILPTFPHIVSDMMKIIEDPMSSAADLAKHMDPSMVGEILKIANSAYFGTRNFRAISTIEHAIAVVGYEHLAHIILQMPFLSMVNGNDKLFDRNKFVRHSIICGAISSAISSAIGLGTPNEAHISGIMHDIGIIILYRHFPEEWQLVNSLRRDKHISRLEAEREALCVDHGFVGASLLELWNIPKTITDSVKFHHEPENAVDNADDVAVTFLANNFAKQIDIKKDLTSFVDFVVTHRDFVEQAVRFKQNFSPREEIRIFESVFNALRNADGYIKGTIEDDG